jgi:hypothetical protein
MTDNSVPKSLDSLFVGEARGSTEDEVTSTKPEGRPQKIGRSISFGDVFVKNKVGQHDKTHALSEPMPLSSSKDDTALPSSTSSGSLKGSGGGEKDSSSGEPKTSSKRQLPPPSLTLPESRKEKSDTLTNSLPTLPSTTTGDQLLATPTPTTATTTPTTTTEPKPERESKRGSSGSHGSLPSLDLTSSAPPGRGMMSDRSPSKSEREKGVKKVCLIRASLSFVLLISFRVYLLSSSIISSYLNCLN